MKAVRLHEYGGIDVLQVEEVPAPVPGDGEVLVRVKAAGINPGEAAIRSGALKEQMPSTFPSGEGSDLAGVVEASNAPGFEVGDEVLGYSWSRSSHAELAAVPATQLIHKPAGLSWEVAGALYVVGCTAFASARAVNAGPGDRVVVSAAAGGVGSVLVQLLKSYGCEVVGIASQSNHAWLRSLGVEPVAYGEGMAAAIGHADAFCDCFGPDYLQLALDLGIAKDRINTIIAFQAAGKLGTKAEGSSEASTPEVLTTIAELVAKGEIDIPVAATYPLAEVQAAFTELEKRHTRGKIVLIP